MHSDGGKCKSFKVLKKEFELVHNEFFRYLQLRDYYEKNIKPGLSERGNTVTDILKQAHKEDSKKIILDDMADC